VKRVLGAVLALLGLGVAVVGVWLTLHLGTVGRAAFTMRPAEDGPVVLGPEVVNRVDLPVTVTARAAGGATVWIGIAAPTDARSALGSGGQTVVRGVSFRDWGLLSRRTGSGAARELVHTDLWRVQSSGKGAASVTLSQANAPETVVVTVDGGPVRSVAMSVAKRTWFVQSLLAALSGLLLAIAGITVAVTAGRPPVAWESLAPMSGRGDEADARAVRQARGYQPRRAATKSQRSRR
jgi:hypothetical protein